MGWGVHDYPEPPDWWWKEHGFYEGDEDDESYDDIEITGKCVYKPAPEKVGVV